MKKILYSLILIFSLSSRYTFCETAPEEQEKYGYDEQELKKLEKDIEDLGKTLENFDTKLPKFRKKEEQEKYGYNEKELKKLEKDIEDLGKTLEKLDTKLPKFTRKKQ